MAEPPWLEEAMEKYKQKLHHVRLRKVLEEAIPKASEKSGIAQAQNRRIIDKITPILNSEGVLPDFRVAYQNYALALDKSQRTLKFMVDLIREHQILRDRWQSRGLNPDVLDKIDAMLIFRREG